MSLQHDRRKRVSARTARRAGAAKTSRIPLPAVAGVTITHPERIVYADSGVTKLMVAEYYTRVGPRLLPHVAGRPVSIVRCPEGAAKPCFYQKHAGNAAIPGVRGAMIEDGNGRHPYLVADTVKALAGLAQMNVLELHVWGARVATIERPDTMVLDLDPDPALPWAKVVAAARLTRALLGELGLEAFVKTTGGRGLHVVVPLERRHGWDEVKGFAQRVAAHLARHAARRSSRPRWARSGGGARSSSITCATRAARRRSRPIRCARAPARQWRRRSHGTSFRRRCRRRNSRSPRCLARIERRPDPWADYERRRQRITATMRRALGG